MASVRDKKLDEVFFNVRSKVMELAEQACSERDIYGVHFAVQQTLALDRMERSLKNRFQRHEDM